MQHESHLNHHLHNSSDFLKNLNIDDLGLSDLFIIPSTYDRSAVGNTCEDVDLESWENAELTEQPNGIKINLIKAQELARNELLKLSESSVLEDKLKLVFGDSFDSELALQILEKFAHQDFSELAGIELVDKDAIAGGEGAFVSAIEIIYLSNQFLEANLENSQAIGHVLIEELEHYLDDRVNSDEIVSLFPTSYLAIDSKISFNSYISPTIIDAHFDGDLHIDLYKEDNFITTLFKLDPFKDNQAISLKDLEPILSELSQEGDYSLKVSIISPDGTTKVLGSVDKLLQN
jgi:hypothetical protein